MVLTSPDHRQPDGREDAAASEGGVVVVVPVLLRHGTRKAWVPEEHT